MILPLTSPFFFLSDDKGMLHLRKTFDYGKSFHTIATRVYSFVLGGRFVFASIMTGTVRLCVCVCARAPLYLYSLRAECVCFVNRHCIFAVCVFSGIGCSCLFVHSFSSSSSSFYAFFTQFAKQKYIFSLKAFK